MKHLFTFSSIPWTPHVRRIRTKSFQRVFQKPEASIEPERRNPSWKLRGKERPFVDFCRFQAQAGAGGDGCISFLKEKYNPRGPPNGGNGGRGGSIYIVASKEETSLRHVSTRYKGVRGEHGKGKLMHGQNARNTEIIVPLGTNVRWTVEVEEEKPDLDEDLDRYFKFSAGYEPLEDRRGLLKEKLMLMFPGRYRGKKSEPRQGQMDLITDGQRFEVLKGGMGGFGNPAFVSKQWLNPKVCGRGHDGEVGKFELELKTIADVGLVGMPNAGKSSLLAAISNAHPKIASYAFTTLNPYVATIDYENHEQVTVADIPGLIPGAHLNIGLGHDFLRHVERCKALVYVVDLSRPTPWEDLKLLQQELEAYKKGLTAKPSIVIANKADVENSKENYAEFMHRLQDLDAWNQWIHASSSTGKSNEMHELNPKDARKKQSITLIPCSSKYQKNIKMVTDNIRELVHQNE